MTQSFAHVQRQPKMMPDQENVARVPIIIKNPFELHRLLQLQPKSISRLPILLLEQHLRLLFFRKTTSARPLLSPILSRKFTRVWTRWVLLQATKMRTASCVTSQWTTTSVSLKGKGESMYYTRPLALGGNVCL